MRRQLPIGRALVLAVSAAWSVRLLKLVACHEAASNCQACVLMGRLRRQMRALWDSAVALLKVEWLVSWTAPW